MQKYLQYFTTRLKIKLNKKEENAYLIEISFNDYEYGI